jgi:hypothetical protein
MFKRTNLTREPGKVPGVLIEFGGVKYLMPPLNVDGLEEHDDAIQRVQSEGDITLREKITLICAIALSALRRNYPDLNMEFMKKWVDMGNMQEIFRAVMGVSGFEEAKSGEAGSDGTGPT